MLGLRLGALERHQMSSRRRPRSVRGATNVQAAPGQDSAAARGQRILRMKHASYLENIRIPSADAVADKKAEKASGPDMEADGAVSSLTKQLQRASKAASVGQSQKELRNGLALKLATKRTRQCERCRMHCSDPVLSSC